MDNFMVMVTRDQAIVLSKFCPNGLPSFMKEIQGEQWQVNGLLVLNSILVALIIWIGVYNQRYRHHPLTYKIFELANLMFLPVIDNVVSNSAGNLSIVIPSIPNEFKTIGATLTAVCTPDQHSVMVIIWALIVQIIIINTRVMVAVDHREDPSSNIGLYGVTVQAIFTLYLGLKYMQKDIMDKMFLLPIHRGFILSGIFYSLLEVSGFLLTMGKLVFKLYAVAKAQQSYAFARNPGFVSAYTTYMKALPEPPVNDDAPPLLPPLLVMGENKAHVKEENDRYVLQGGNGLITSDTISQFLNGNNNNIAARLKDLCLSFSLFKLLRCRFANLELTHARFQKFLWSLLITDGKIFGVIVDELSFLQDYYNSSLPISYSIHWLPLVGILLSVWSIIHCVAVAVWIIICIVAKLPEMTCNLRCNDSPQEDSVTITSGSMTLNLVLLFVILVFVIAAEVSDIVSYICSNWAKVFHTCQLNNGYCLPLEKLYTQFLHLKIKLINNHWDQKINQCTVLPLDLGTRMLVRCMLHVSEPKIKLDRRLKNSIIRALLKSKVNDGVNLRIGQTSLLQHGDAFLWSFSGNSVSKIILRWQIATSIVKVRYPLSSNEISSVATVLSQYCVYLVRWYPTLLPGNNDNKWSKSLYEEVKKDAQNAIGQSCYSVSLNYLTRPTLMISRYQDLVRNLDNSSNHEVLKQGVKLGKQLVQAFRGEQDVWKLLEEFWTELILYVAPSNNLEGHKKAMSLGGELITVLWALLNHLGNVNKLAIETVADN